MDIVFCLCKPHVEDKVFDIIAYASDKHFFLVGQKVVEMDLEMARKFYSYVTNKDKKKRLMKNMVPGRSTALLFRYSPPQPVVPNNMLVTRTTTPDEADNASMPTVKSTTGADDKENIVTDEDTIKLRKQQLESKRALQREKKEDFQRYLQNLAQPTTQAMNMFFDFIGPEDPEEAREVDPESIRALFGVDVISNAVATVNELNIMRFHTRMFFPEVKMAYLTGKDARTYLTQKDDLAKVLREGMVEVYKRQPADPVHALAMWCLNYKGRFAQKRYFILGAPGTGKSTIAQKLIDEKDHVLISTADLIRNEAKQMTDIGKVLRNLMKNKEIIPEEITISLLIAAFDLCKDAKAVLIEGFPRRLTLAGMYEREIGDFTKVIYFDCNDKDVLYKRVEADNIALGKKPESKEAIFQRIDNFESSAAPVLQYYGSRGDVIKLDAKQPVDKVYKDLVEAMQI